MNPAQAALDLKIMGLENMMNGDHPGIFIDTSYKPYKRRDKKEVVDWIKSHVAGVGGPILTVPVGMFNGLLTRASDLAGSGALAMAQRALKRIGYVCVFLGTNDDSTAVIAVPEGTGDEVHKCIQAMFRALEGACAYFGIIVNSSKMNASAVWQELNTISIAVKGDGMLTTMLPAERSLLGATRRTPGFDLVEEAFSALSAAGPGLKEGADLATSYVASAFATLSRLEIGKLGNIALATAAGIAMPGGLPALGVSPAPHLNGMPLIRPYWSVFPANAQCAAAIVERLLVQNPRSGVYTSKKYGLKEDELIDRVCRTMTAVAISQQCKALSDYKYESKDEKEDLSIGIGPFSACVKGAPTKFEIGDHSDKLLSPEFLKDMDVTHAAVGLRGSIRHAVQSSYQTLASEMAKNPERLQCRLVQKALVQSNTGGAPTKGTVWSPKADTSTLPKRFLITRPVLVPNEKGGPTWGRVHGEVSLWWLLESWARHDWEHKEDLNAPLITILISGMKANVRAMLESSRYLATNTMGLVEGHRLTMYRSQMSIDSPLERLTALDLARLLDPSPARSAGMELGSLATRSQNAELRSTDLSILGGVGVKVTLGDLEVIRKVSFTITKHLEAGTLKGFIIPRIFPRPSLIDAAMCHATCNIGQNISAQRVPSLPMPPSTVDPVFTTITPDLIDTHASACIVAFLEAKVRHPVYTNAVVGQFPAGDSRGYNSLRGTNLHSLMVGFKVAAAGGYVLRLAPMDMKILSTKELNTHPMTFVHVRPGLAVRNVLGCRLEPVLSEDEITMRRSAYEHKMPPPHRNLRADQITHVFSTVTLKTITKEVDTDGVKMNHLAYRYQHNVYIQKTRSEVRREGLQLVLNYKVKGIKKTLYVHGDDFERISGRIVGDSIEVFWGCKFYATVACYPPHACMALVGSEWDLVPIAGLDCRQSLQVDLWKAPIAGPEVFTASWRSPTTDLEELFINHASELAAAAGAVSMASALASSLMVMTPWEMVKTYIVSILMHKGHLGTADANWCFGPLSSKDRLLRLSQLNVSALADKIIGDTRLIATIFKVRSANVSALFFNTNSSGAIETAIKAFRTEIVDEEWYLTNKAAQEEAARADSEKGDTVVSDEEWLRRNLTPDDLDPDDNSFYARDVRDEYRRRFQSPAPDEAKTAQPVTPDDADPLRIHTELSVDSFLRMGSRVLESAVDDEVSNNGGRQLYIQRKMPRDVMPKATVTVHVPVTVTKVSVETKSEEISASDKKVLADLMEMSSAGIPDIEDDDDDDMGEEVPAGIMPEIGNLTAILESKTQNVSLDRETTTYPSRMADDGFQMTQENLLVAEDAFVEDFDEDELMQVMRMAEGIPFQDKEEYKNELINLNMTTARITGIWAGKAAMARGAKGGGYYAYTSKELSGGLTPAADAEGYKWMRVPITVWATILERSNTYAPTMKSTLFDTIKPPKPESPAMRTFLSYDDEKSFKVVSISKYTAGKSLYSSSVSALTSAYFKIGETLIPHGQATVASQADLRQQAFELADGKKNKRLLSSRGGGKG